MSAEAVVVAANIYIKHSNILFFFSLLLFILGFTNSNGLRRRSINSSWGKRSSIRRRSRISRRRRIHNIRRRRRSSSRQSISRRRRIIIRRSTSRIRRRMRNCRRRRRSFNRWLFLGIFLVLIVCYLN